MPSLLPLVIQLLLFKKQQEHRVTPMLKHQLHTRITCNKHTDDIPVRRKKYIGYTYTTISTTHDDHVTSLSLYLLISITYIDYNQTIIIMLIFTWLKHAGNLYHIISERSEVLNLTVINMLIVSSAVFIAL